MGIIFEERQSDSPFIETIWRSYAGDGGHFMSLAVSRWQMVVSRLRGRIAITLRGPETRASDAYCPPDAEFVGVFFRLGTFMPRLPASQLVDGELWLPQAGSRSFWLHGSTWQFPDFENIDVFVDRLFREGLLVHEPIVDAALQGRVTGLSQRSVQRRFLRATGLTHTNVHQIERARYATALLRQGMSILDVVDLAGYTDQPHLTRALKRWIGQTLAQIAAGATVLGFSRPFMQGQPLRALSDTARIGA